MGYYSDVRLSVSKEGYEQLSSFIESWCKKEESINPLEYCDKLFRSEEGYLICWNDWKWYDFFPEIKAVYEGLKNLEETNFSYDYCRLGEEIGDVETCYNHSTRENEPDPENYMPGISQHFDDRNIIQWCDMADVKGQRNLDDLEL